MARNYQAVFDCELAPGDPDNNYFKDCMRAFDPASLRVKRHHEPLDSPVIPRKWEDEEDTDRTLKREGR